jgi:hypothetical protein
MGVQVIKFLENNLPSFSQHREKVGMKRMNGCKKKTYRTSLNTESNLAGLFFAKSSHMEKSQNNKEKDKGEEKEE